MKPVRILVLVVALLSMSSLPSSADDDFGSFLYWYSNASKIGYLAETSPTVGFGKTENCGMDVNKLTTYVNHSLNVWPLAEISYTQGSFGTSVFNTACISRSEANDLGIPSNYAGWTGLVATTVGFGTYNGSRKDVIKITEVHIRYIWDTKTSSWTDTQWKANAAHEHGHGIGYSGHDTTTLESEALMYGGGQDSVTAPKTRDINHMSNVYSMN